MMTEEEAGALTQDSRKPPITSDGTATLRFFDPETFHEVRRITVKDNGKPVTYLNELEYIHGEIYANVWQTDPHRTHLAGYRPRRRLESTSKA